MQINCSVRLRSTLPLLWSRVGRCHCQSSADLQSRLGHLGVPGSWGPGHQRVGRAVSRPGLTQVPSLSTSGMQTGTLGFYSSEHRKRHQRAGVRLVQQPADEGYSTSLPLGGSSGCRLNLEAPGLSRGYI